MCIYNISNRRNLTLSLLTIRENNHSLFFLRINNGRQKTANEKFYRAGEAPTVGFIEEISRHLVQR